MGFVTQGPRLRPQVVREKKRWWRTLATKDVIIITISLAALFISMLTAYFSFFRQYDEVSVVIEQFPVLELYSKEKVAISGDCSAVARSKSL